MKTTAFLILSLLVLASCTQVPTQPTTPEGDTTLETIESEAAFRSIFTANNNYYGNIAAQRAMTMDAVAESAAPTSAGENDGVDYSDTNVQVEGVDEADLIKTDGKYIYTISGQQVFIIDAYPGEEAEIIAEIELENSNPSNLFIDEDRLVVLGTTYNFRGEARSIWPGNSNTLMYIYDISDREEPELIEDYHVDGSYAEARLKDEYVYLATNTWPNYGYPELPVIMRGDDVHSVAVDTIFRFPVPYNNPHLTNLYSVNVQSPSDVESVSVVTEGNSQLYMSQENIYLTSTQHVDTWRIEQETIIDLLENDLSEEEQDLIERIRAIDEDIMSEDEKRNKILTLVQRYASQFTEAEAKVFERELEQAYERRLSDYKYFEHTLISRISYEEGKLTVVADGKIPGSVNNQFSMDEYEGVLRVATTINTQWNRFVEERTESQNHIYTLDEDLDKLDSITGLAEGERIFSARFMGERLYLVTFRQVDPFFAVDLSNPEDIEILGELKIPGFSRYLHPYDDNVIIGLGRDANLQGQTQGLKISLFDVSDVSNPEEIASYREEGRYSSSTAEYEHKAFLFSKEKNLLVIPVYNYDYEEGDYFNGVFVFDIQSDSIEKRGVIQHNVDEKRQWRAGIERSLYIEELLYTKSYELLQINDLETLEEVNEVELDVEEETYEPYMRGGPAIPIEEGIASMPDDAATEESS